MKLFADLHIHSHYSRATSKEMNLEGITKYAKIKGLGIVGTGDFTHPKWFEELKEKLKFNGDFYEYNNIFFVFQTEISNIYSHKGKLRKVHHVILAPDINTVEKLNSEFKKWGRVDYDGRPIFGKSSKELVKMVYSINEMCEVIPAHVWTPWFGVFGSKSGYDSLEECYEEEVKKIHAIETGLSSDPEMNWRISALDKYTLISNSDSHSPWPWRLGRECNLLDVNNYEELIKAIRTKKGLIMTIEVDPAYGKYHWDGHRNCNISMPPKESIKRNNVCPRCGRPLTIGVEHRVEELADRPEGYVPEGATPFKKLIPLSEIISIIRKKGIATKYVWEEYMKWIQKFNTELNLMIYADEEEIKRFDKKIGNIIIKLRENKIKVKPGYDGEYGTPILDTQTSIENFL